MRFYSPDRWPRTSSADLPATVLRRCVDQWRRKTPRPRWHEIGVACRLASPWDPARSLTIIAIIANTPTPPAGYMKYRIIVAGRGHARQGGHGLLAGHRRD